MRIAINGRVLIKNKLEGIGYFTWEVLKNMVRLYPEHDYLVFFDRKPDREFLIPGIEFKVLRPAARHPVLYRIWFDLLVPLHVRMWDAEIFVSFDGFTSLKLNIPVVTAIHDLAYLHFPSYMKATDLHFYQKYQPKFARISDRILTVSSYSATDIADKYGIDEDEIEVVYNGSRFEKSPPSPDLSVLERYDLQPGEYVIYTGSLHPRKNILRLIQGFERSEAANGHRVKLVLAGRKAWDAESIFEMIEHSPVADLIVHTGYVSDSDLWNLLCHSLCLCYVSLFEGFGVPVLDAFHAEVPVVCSQSTSLPEVAGQAACLVDENDAGSISRAIDEMYTDPELRQRLVDKGIDRRRMFSWTSTTQRIFHVIEEVYGERYGGTG